MKISLLIQRIFAAAGAWGLAAQAHAAATMPEVGQMHMMPANSPVMEKLTSFHDLMVIIITVVSLFVLALMIYVCVRFRASANPVPSKVSHNTAIEIIWTLVPALILVTIAIPSLRTLYYMDRIEDADMTLKVVGYQWYWHYQYPDHGNFEYDSRMVEEKDLVDKKMRLLEVDNAVVVPVGKKVRVLITGADVIHSWAMPVFGIKTDAVPGRLNETWFQALREGDYYGQCSELCGVNHGFMPIHVKVVSQEEFDLWVADAKTRLLSSRSEPMRVAQAQ